MKLISWNVNGVRSAVRKGLVQFILDNKPDIIAIQEIKADVFDLPVELSQAGYTCYLNPATRKGYSGTMIISRFPGIRVTSGIGDSKFDDEGRIQIADLKDIYFLNVYFPNSQRELTRLGFKQEFNKLFLDRIIQLQETKPIVACGDFNVAHTELDIARPKENQGTHGFTKEEREGFSEFLRAGFVDTFRLFQKEGGHYSWWSNMGNARERNIGWRIDYFISSSSLVPRISSSRIMETVQGSDHAPIELILN
jgi:exodeoxyribonuclease-3